MNRSYSKLRHIQESNIILEQRRLDAHKSRTSNQYLMEQSEEGTTNFDKNYFMTKKTGTVNFSDYGQPTMVDGVEVTDYENQWKNNFTIINIGGRGFRGGNYNWTFGDKVDSGRMGPDEQKPGISITNNENQEVGTLQF